MIYRYKKAPSNLSLVLLLGYVSQPLHQKLSHLVYGGRLPELLTQQQPLDLILKPVAYFLVRLLYF